MANELIIIRHSGLRTIAASEVLAAIPPSELGLPRIDEHIDTTEFAAQIEQEDWGDQDSHLGNRAAAILSIAEKRGDAALHYFGLAEIPHVLALGAYLGDERHIAIHEFDRDSNSWAWPKGDSMVMMETQGLPGLPAVSARGDAVLRVELSATISDEDIREAVGEDLLANLRVVLATGLTPAICKVRSEADLMIVRAAVRDALAGLKAARPNLDTIHLFIAAPVSVCFAVGQELKPRNSPPIQTYRFRRVEGQPAYKPALVLRGGDDATRDMPLSREQVARAKAIREIWDDVLVRLEGYAANRRSPGQPSVWYAELEPQDGLHSARPFPSLKAFAQLLPEGAKVDPDPFPAEYGFDKDRKLWRVSDRLLAGLDVAAGGDEERLRQIIRLFLFHEYLHDFHSLTKYTAAEVGKFPNCLEYIDYTADAYALIHQLDYQHLHHHATVKTEDAKRSFVADQIDLVIRSFWAFELQAPVVEWQLRRLRRYLNWYWRHAQVKRATDIGTVLTLLGKAPHVEIAGLHQFARGRRVLVRLDRFDRTTSLELALVMEDCRLMRLADSPMLGVSEIASAFVHGEHEEIQRFFNAVFEEAAQRSGALPAN